MEKLHDLLTDFRFIIGFGVVATIGCWIYYYTLGLSDDCGGNIPAVDVDPITGDLDDSARCAKIFGHDPNEEKTYFFGFEVSPTDLPAWKLLTTLSCSLIIGCSMLGSGNPIMSVLAVCCGSAVLCMFPHAVGMESCNKRNNTMESTCLKNELEEPDIELIHAKIGMTLDDTGKPLTLPIITGTAYPPDEPIKPKFDVKETNLLWAKARILAYPPKIRIVEEKITTGTAPDGTKTTEKVRKPDEVVWELPLEDAKEIALSGGVDVNQWNITQTANLGPNKLSTSADDWRLSTVIGVTEDNGDAIVEDRIGSQFKKNSGTTRGNKISGDKEEELSVWKGGQIGNVIEKHKWKYQLEVYEKILPNQDFTVVWHNNEGILSALENVKNKIDTKFMPYVQQKIKHTDILNIETRFDTGLSRILNACVCLSVVFGLWLITSPIWKALDWTTNSLSKIGSSGAQQLPGPLAGIGNLFNVFAGVLTMAISGIGGLLGFATGALKIMFFIVSACLATCCFVITMAVADGAINFDEHGMMPKLRALVTVIMSIGMFVLLGLSLRGQDTKVIKKISKKKR